MRKHGFADSTSVLTDWSALSSAIGLMFWIGYAQCEQN